MLSPCLQGDTVLIHSPSNAQGLLSILRHVQDETTAEDQLLRLSWMALGWLVAGWPQKLFFALFSKKSRVFSS